MGIYRLAVRSLANRRLTAGLTVAVIALSVTLLLGVEKVRREAKTSFANTISGTDLIVGARSGAIQLLLYSVFRIGNATNNISRESYREIAALPDVRWTVPLSLGDSHRGYRVVGTTPAYFDHYQVGRGRALKFAEGSRFDDLYDVVLGAEVAAELGYALGQPIVIAHGIGAVTMLSHETQPFTVSGILARTGTPVDRSLHVSLEAISAIHVGWEDGVPTQPLDAAEARLHDLRPRAITAFLVGLESKFALLRLQRAINEYRGEPLLAILPGVALQELWDVMSVAETALLAVSALVVITGLAGMAAVLLSGLSERRREMAILRSVGARPVHVFALLVAEAGLLASLGAAIGLVVTHLCLWVAQGIIETRIGLYVPVTLPSAADWMLLGAIVAMGFVVGVIPAWRAYRYSLADGMSIRT